MNSGRVVAGVFALAPFGILLATQQPAKRVSYATDVAPVFRAHCNSCHSGTDPAGKLDLSSPEGIKKGGISGSVFSVSKPDTSIVIQRIVGGGGKPRMPLGFPPLPNEDVEKIQLWIAGGARTSGPGNEQHWAYLKPVRPAVPRVKNRAWVRNPIDNFVLARLEQEGLTPSPEASKETLIRRVSLDLTGLPPSPKEIDAFLADKRPAAYERLVDRLLSSAHYGERQARPWLDLSRYADSDGYEKDLNRTAWEYRDWLINAFNRNMPYNEFTIEQLAGDQMPFKDTSQLVATGFNRNTMFNREGGVDQAEAHFNVVLDRVNTTATVWLGSTIQCARCHDHKYDPFSQKDFYKLSAYFENSVIIPRGPASIGEEKWFESEMQIPTGQQVAEKTKLLLAMDAVRGQIETETSIAQSGYENWKTAAAKGVQWSTLHPTSTTSEAGATLTTEADDSILASNKLPDQDNYTVKATGNLNGATGLRIEAMTDSSLPDNGPGRTGNFVLTGLSVKIDGQPVPLRTAVADFVQDQFDPDQALSRNTLFGWAIHPQRGRPHEMAITFEHPITATASSTLEVTLEHQYPERHHILGHFRLSVTDAPDLSRSCLPSAMQAILENASPSSKEDGALKAYYLSRAPGLRLARNHLKVLEQRMRDLENTIPTALVMRDKPSKGPLTAYIHTRGEFLNKAEMVTAGTPAVFGKTDPKLPGNRLGLAEWIASKNNPLTARVEVNRLWEEFFGRGIVETSEDFGTQGARPTHPALLDWLATEFMDRGWNMKAINRMIVLSSTYRQSSNATPALMQLDPQNQLLARGPRFRLEAEAIRDLSLSAAGILDPKVGGPSVYPDQPAGTWDTPYNGEQWMTSKGGEAFRRGLYTFWKRSSPYPSFMAFDATSREECTVRRIRTNTPLQALAMLNDEAVFVAAKALGRRMVKEGGSTEAQKLTFGFRACTGRKPTAHEAQRLEQLFAKLTSRYTADPHAAAKLGGSATAAAYTMEANVLLNLDETLTKG